MYGVAESSRSERTPSEQSGVGDEQLRDADQDIEDELGDVFFSLVNYARFLQMDAENALERTNKKFISRFTRMEEEALRQNRNLHDMTLEEMDAIWNSMKLQKPS